MPTGGGRCVRPPPPSILGFRPGFLLVSGGHPSSAVSGPLSSSLTGLRCTWGVFENWELFNIPLFSPLSTSRGPPPLLGGGEAGGGMPAPPPCVPPGTSRGSSILSLTRGCRGCRWPQSLPSISFHARVSQSLHLRCLRGPQSLLSRLKGSQFPPTSSFHVRESQSLHLRCSMGPQSLLPSLRLSQSLSTCSFSVQ